MYFLSVRCNLIEMLRCFLIKSRSFIVMKKILELQMPQFLKGPVLLFPVFLLDILRSPCRKV